MIVAPAVDVRGGRCVQLVGGVPGSEQVSLPEPASVARRWWDAGFGTLHVVDLDAALGEGDNLDVIPGILRGSPATKQVGGGIRDVVVVETMISLGADRVIVGTRAVEDPEWLARLAGRCGDRIVVGADVRDGRVLTRGWQESANLTLEAFFERIAPLELGGVITTDVGREGRLGGIDRKHVARVIETAPFPAWIAGGITDMDDLGFLAERGAHGAVIGMALYQGTLDVTEVAKEFGR